MASAHPCFYAPKNPATPLWRYMDFTKFVALLESGALFFARADTLGDPWEGAVSRWTILGRTERFEDDPNSALLPPEHHPVQQLSRLYRRLPSLTFVSCWHMNESESVAMWKLYCPSGPGVAIKSTYEKLFKLTPPNVFCGMVSYANYDRILIPDANTFQPFLFKRLSFLHEHEVRAVIQHDPATVDESAQLESGKCVSVNMHDLVDSIHVSPGAPKWYGDLVRSILLRYKLEKPVHHSAIDSPAVY